MYFEAMRQYLQLTLHNQNDNENTMGLIMKDVKTFSRKPKMLCREPFSETKCNMQTPCMLFSVSTCLSRLTAVSQPALLQIF